MVKKPSISLYIILFLLITIISGIFVYKININALKDELLTEQEKRKTELKELRESQIKLIDSLANETGKIDTLLLENEKIVYKPYVKYKYIYLDNNFDSAYAIIKGARYDEE